MRFLRFTSPGEPRAKARPRVARGRAYTPVGTKVAELALSWEATVAMRGRPPADGPLDVSIFYHMKTDRRVDIDNLCKLTLDALNGIVWHDDSQIRLLHLTKTKDPTNPRTEITVYQIVELVAA